MFVSPQLKKKGTIIFLRAGKVVGSMDPQGGMDRVLGMSDCGMEPWDHTELRMSHDNGQKATVAEWARLFLHVYPLRCANRADMKADRRHVAATLAWSCKTPDRHWSVTTLRQIMELLVAVCTTVSQPRHSVQLEPVNTPEITLISLSLREKPHFNSECLCIID
jgi:hypothetical protein